MCIAAFLHLFSKFYNTISLRSLPILAPRHDAANHI